MPAQNVTTFQFEVDKSIRNITKDGAPWFAAVDVCRALGLSDERSSIRSLDNDEKGWHTISTLGGEQTITIVSESGLYALFLGSRSARKPDSQAHKFRRWVTSDLLPAVRKTGRYESPTAVPRIVIEDAPSAIANATLHLENVPAYASMVTLVRDAWNIRRDIRRLNKTRNKEQLRESNRLHLVR